MKRAERLALALVLAAGLGLRLANLGKHRLFVDEALGWATIQLSALDILKQLQNDLHPVFYFYLLKLWHVFVPQSEVGLRALSVVFSLGALVGVMFLAYRWWGWQAAALAGWFFSLSSFDIYYAQEVRMYTLLGLLWLLCYGLLVEALGAQPRAWLAWGAVAVLTAWTHVYGLFLVYLYLGFLGVYCLVAGRVRSLIFPIPPGRFWGVMGFVVGATLPVVWFVWRLRGGASASTWVPRADELLILWGLLTVGLTAGRMYFLDGTHLTLPALAAFPVWGWALVGVSLAGVFAAQAGLGEWRQGQRLRPGLALLTLLLPLGLFAYTVVFQQPQWALKPFLGLGYILALWVGAGLSQARRTVRVLVPALMLGVAGLSLYPYYTTWTKIPAAEAFFPHPVEARPQMVLLDPFKRVPTAFYYLGTEADLWGVLYAGQGQVELYRISAPGILEENYTLSGCDDPAVAVSQVVWVYGPPEQVRPRWPDWPACLHEKAMYYYENGTWQPLQ